MLAINVFSIKPPSTGDAAVPSPGDKSQQQAKSEAQQLAIKFSIEFFGRILHSYCQSAKKKKPHSMSPSKDDDNSSDDEEASPRPTIIKTEPTDSNSPAAATTSTTTTATPPERFVNTEVIHFLFLFLFR